MPLIGISGREFAKKHNKSEGAVRKHKIAGTLTPFEDGSFDPDTPWPSDSEVRTLSEEGAETDLDSLVSDLDDNCSLTDARRVETIIRAKRRGLQLERERKELVPLKHVQKHVERIVINIRQTIQHIPSRYASQIAAKLGCDAVLLDAELSKAIAAELNDLAAPVVPAD